MYQEDCLYYDHLDDFLPHPDHDECTCYDVVRPPYYLIVISRPNYKRDCDSCYTCYNTVVVVPLDCSGVAFLFLFLIFLVCPANKLGCLRLKAEHRVLKSLDWRHHRSHRRRCRVVVGAVGRNRVCLQTSTKGPGS